VNVVGAGSFAQRILIPGLQRAGFTLGAIASAKGLSAKAVGERFGFVSTVSPEEALVDPSASVVAIATRHSSHADLAAAALRAGKAVFLEKPPCLTAAELDALRSARTESGQLLRVGFNRRHAPLAIAMREHVRRPSGAIELLYRVNAGQLPSDHWLKDEQDEGGRLLGEGCHFVDFACWLIGARPSSVTCVPSIDRSREPSSVESFTIALGFPDGSLATIVYAVRGAPGLGKEYVEAHAGGASACLDDYRTLITHDGRRRHRRRQGKQDKGHFGQFSAFQSDLAGTSTPELDPLESMAATLEAYDSMRSRTLSTSESSSHRNGNAA
jgi:predicted dehydrogenase